MVDLDTVLKKLPLRNEIELVVVDQDEQNIIDEILEVHNEYAGDYDLIYKYFDQGKIEDSGRCLWDFLKDNLQYDAESVHDQTVRSPARILQVADKVDCKHYSLFTAGVLDAIKRHKKDDSWNWTYRFASYNWEPVAAHVFVVVTAKDGEIWIDPVLDSFNEDKFPTWETDCKPMALYKLSGPNDLPMVAGVNNVQVVYNRKVANRDFLIWIEKNLFSVKELFLRNPDIVNGPVKKYCQANGIDFNVLKILLNQ